MNKATDLTGQQFGNWTVLHRAPPAPTTPSKGTLWTCQCGCGTVRPVNAAHLTNRRSTSCGCLRQINRMPPDQARSHRNPTYRAWQALKTRCLNPNHPTYDPGNRLAPEWLDYARFVADMGSRPPGTALARLTPSKEYSKQNCRWEEKGA